MGAALRADRSPRLERVVPAGTRLPPVQPAGSLDRVGGPHSAPNFARHLAEELPRVWHTGYQDAHTHFYVGPDDTFENIV